MSGGAPAGERREAIAQIVARAYGGSLYPGLGTPGDYPTADVDYRAADAILALPTPTPPIEGRDADVEREEWLRGDWYEKWQDATEDASDDLMATLEALRVRVERTILAALQALGERP